MSGKKLVTENKKHVKTAKKKKISLSTAELEIRRKSFVENFLQTRNQTQAAILSGYSPNGARVQGHRLLTNANIQKEISKRLSIIYSREKIKSKDVISQLIRIGFSDIANFVEMDKNGNLVIHAIQDLPPELRCAVESISQRADGSLSIKLCSKVEALKQLSLIYKLVEPEVPIGTNIEKAVFIIPGFSKDKFPNAPVSKEIIERDRKVKEEHERKLKNN